MIKGLDVFRRHFEHYTDRYVLIGGVGLMPKGRGESVARP